MNDNTLYCSVQKKHIIQKTYMKFKVYFKHILCGHFALRVTKRLTAHK